MNTAGLTYRFDSPNPASMYAGNSFYMGSPGSNHPHSFWSGSARVGASSNWGLFQNIQVLASSGSNGTGGSFGMHICSWLPDTICIVLPVGCSSGSSLSASSTFNSTTLSQLKLYKGTYVFEWGVGANVDRLTLQIGPSGIVVGNPANATNPYSTTLNGGTLIVDIPGLFVTAYSISSSSTIDINGVRPSFAGVFQETKA